MSTLTEIIYSDIIANFEANPLTDDVGMALNTQAVKDSLFSLINTNKGERPYHPEIGGDIRSLLFETVDFITANALEVAIEELILNWEPRVVLEQVIATPFPDQNQFDIKIIFYIINNLQNKETLSTELKANGN